MAKTDVTTVDENIPSYLQAMQGNGPATLDDNFDSDDVVVPQIKLLQGTSDQVQDFDDAKPGIFWHTGLDQPLGDSIRFVVCSRKKKYLLQAPMDDGQGVLARAEDAKTWDKLGEWEVQVDKKTKVTWTIADLDVVKSGLAEWGTHDPTDPENSPPAATLFYEYLIILPDFPEMGPAVMSLARSAIRKAKKELNTKISLHAQNGRPMQACAFTASPTGEVNEAGQDFFNWHFGSGGFVDEEIFNTAKNMAEVLGDYKVQDEGADTEGGVVDDDSVEI